MQSTHPLSPKEIVELSVPQDEKVWEKHPDSPFPAANGIILLQKVAI